MIQQKKAIGFFYGVGFFTILYLLLKTKPLVSFSDFALFEWQIKLVLQGKFSLPYSFISTDPNLDFFPLPDLFFHLSPNRVDSTFPNLYPILVAPIYFTFGKFGIQIIQVALLFLSLWFFYQIKKDHLFSLLLLFGSSIPIYTNLIHDTILVFFLEILVLYYLHKKSILLASFLSIVLIWMRPEFGFVIVLLPFFFEWRTIGKQFFVWCLCFGVIFACTNWIVFDTFFPLRLLKNASYHWNSKIVLYLFRLLVEQIPIFSLFFIFSLTQLFFKKFRLVTMGLFVSTCLILILSPNTGGHNTPRYFYCLVPLYILSISLGPTFDSQKRKAFTLLFLILMIYSVYKWTDQSKELMKISKFQTNTLTALSSITEKTFVFNNSDFSFVALPILESGKNLLLLRKPPEENDLGQFLNENQIESFVFLELPPSPFPIPDTLKIPGCKTSCEFKRMKTQSLPDTMLPITLTQFTRIHNEIKKLGLD